MVAVISFIFVYIDVDTSKLVIQIAFSSAPSFEVVKHVYDKIIDMKGRMTYVCSHGYIIFLCVLNNNVIYLILQIMI